MKITKLCTNDNPIFIKTSSEKESTFKVPKLSLRILNVGRREFVSLSPYLHVRQAVYHQKLDPRTCQNVIILDKHLTELAKAFPSSCQND